MDRSVDISFIEVKAVIKLFYKKGKVFLTERVLLKKFSQKSKYILKKLVVAMVVLCSMGAFGL